MVLSTWGWDIDHARRAELERWVEAGGRLVVDAALISGSDAFEQWSGIAREREEPDPDEDLVQAPEIVEPCEEYRAGARRADAEGDDAGHLRGSAISTYELVQASRPTGTRLLWGL